MFFDLFRTFQLIMFVKNNEKMLYFFNNLFHNNLNQIKSTMR